MSRARIRPGGHDLQRRKYTRALIDEELARRRIDELIEQSSQRTRFDRFLRHPLTTLSLGFVLSGILGTWISEKIGNDRAAAEKELEERRVELAAGYSAVQEFSKLVYERNGRASLLLAAFRRGADSEELVARKLAYDQSFIDWQRQLQSNLLAIRTAQGWADHSPFEQAVEQQLVPIYARLDRVLTAEYDRRIHERPGEPLTEANILLAAARECAHEVTHQLHTMIGRREVDAERGRAPGQDAGLTDQVNTACQEKPSLPPEEEITSP